MKLGLLRFCAQFAFIVFSSGVLYAADYKAALVADMITGQVLYQENANDLNYPASLTKIMTMYLTFDALENGRLNLDDYLIVSGSAANAPPVKLGLKAGSKIKVEDAIKALAVHSSNDVARVLAENLKGGKEGSFASLMTQVATEIGLSRTNFENSSGLPNDDQQSSARDIALLSMAVYKHFPNYWKYYSIKSWTYDGKTYNNGNKLLNTYPGCDGMKTGYTNKSKYSLVSTVKRGDKHLIAVVLGAKNKEVRLAVSKRLLDKGFGTDSQYSANTYKVAAPAPVSSVQNKSAASFGDSKNTSKGMSVKSGSAGVQFGAFSSRSAAATQASRVLNVIGINPAVEDSGSGMYRVRLNNLSQASAQTIKTTASSGGIDCYIFH